MKKYSVLAIALLASACAQGPIIGDENCDYHFAQRKQARVEEVKPAPLPAPTPVVVHQPSPCALAAAQPQIVTTPCNGCQPTVRETREPVEVVYKRVTYTTTYEPKTVSNVTYEREAVKNPVVQEVKVQQPVVKEVVVQRPVVKEVVVQQPTVSRVIEKQVSQEPVRISVEEIK